MKIEDIQRYLPKYLSVDSQKELFDEIKKFIRNEDSYKLFTSFLLDERTIFQGDGLNGFRFYSFDREEIKTAPGIVLSNTCDISLDNERYLPSHIMYSPLINLDKYVLMLENKGITKEKIENHLKSIKNQEYTSIFYLPSIQGKIEESIVYLDRISNMRNSQESTDNLLKERIFTLSNFGFYLFLLKISIHFTRIREGVDRRSA